MSHTLRTNSNPVVLLWARERSGVPIEAAARAIGISPSRLADVEAGNAKLTFRQLQAASNKYKRPLAMFYLPQAPADRELPLRDFRRFGGGPQHDMSPALILELRRARRKRGLALQLDPSIRSVTHDFPTATTVEEPEEIGTKIRTWLEVGPDVSGHWPTTDAALSGWRGELEARGVLILQSSGPHSVELDEMRGFALSEFPLPVIVLNGRDSLSGRVFTLFHELAHLLLRGGGLCQPVTVDEQIEEDSDDRRLEVFCNHIAGSTIIPRVELLRMPEVATTSIARDWDDQSIGFLARHFRVSREALLRRLLILGMTTSDFYRRKRADYLEEYRLRRERERERAREDGGVRIPVPRQAVTRNGPYFSRLVLDALDRDEITFSDAVDYLGVRVRHLDGVNDIVRDSALSA